VAGFRRVCGSISLVGSKGKRLLCADCQKGEADFAGVCVYCWTDRHERERGITRHYFIQEHGIELEVSEEEFVAAERRARFVNSLGRTDKPATGGFGSTVDGNHIRGLVKYHDPASETEY
jgi:hypothetical protein